MAEELAMRDFDDVQDIIHAIKWLMNGQDNPAV